MERFCKIPIDASVEGRRLPEEYFAQEPFPPEYACVPTRHVSVSSNIFVVLHQIASIIREGTVWNKKARIVLEYDPQESKMSITSFMDNDVSVPQADR